MKNTDIINKMFLTLSGIVILLSLITPAIGADRPVEPFRRATALAIKEGTIVESRSGNLYTLTIAGWGVISYTSGDEEYIVLKRGILKEDIIGYYGKYNLYFVIRENEREPMFVDSSVAADMANKYLREIESMRGK